MPGSLTAVYVVVDPRDGLGPSVLPDDSRPPAPEDESAAGWSNGAGVESIGPDHPILPAPELVAGGGADPHTLARVYERRHLLVSVTTPAPAPARVQESESGAGKSRVPDEPSIRPTLVAHIEAALTVAAVLAQRCGGLLLDPVTARFVTETAVGSGRDHLLRISAAGETSGLRMRTMGLRRFGLPELTTRALPPYLGPAWARLMWLLSWRLVGMIPAVWPDLASRRAGGPVGTWSLGDEITLAGTGHDASGHESDPEGDPGTGPGPEPRIRLVLEQDPGAETGVEAVAAGRSLLVVAPRSFIGTEAEWRVETINRLLPRARI